PAPPEQPVCRHWPHSLKKKGEPPLLRPTPQARARRCDALDDHRSPTETPRSLTRGNCHWLQRPCTPDRSREEARGQPRIRGNRWSTGQAGPQHSRQAAAAAPTAPARPSRRRDGAADRVLSSRPTPSLLLRALGFDLAPERLVDTFHHPFEDIS